jgi:hypothetical protein
MMEEDKVICPKCGNDDNFHYNYNYSKKDLPIINILCNECGEAFEKDKIINRDEILESLIGKTKDEVIKICNDNGFTSRIVRNDSINYIITCDYRLDRINLYIDNGLITDCDFG